MMRRSDFQAIADIVRTYRAENRLDRVVLREFTEDMAQYFRKVNPAFDKSKFMKACGYYDE